MHPPPIRACWQCGSWSFPCGCSELVIEDAAADILRRHNERFDAAAKRFAERVKAAESGHVKAVRFMDCSRCDRRDARIADRRDELLARREQHVIMHDHYKADGHWAEAALYAVLIARIEGELAGLTIAMGDEA